MTTNSDFDQGLINGYPTQIDLKIEIDELRLKLDAADCYASELRRGIRNAYIRAYAAEALSDDQESELLQLRHLASRSWKEVLHEELASRSWKDLLLEEVVAAGMRALNRLRQR